MCLVNSITLVKDVLIFSGRYFSQIEMESKPYSEVSE